MGPSREWAYWETPVGMPSSGMVWPSFLSPSLFPSYGYERCTLLGTPAIVYGPHQRPTIMETTGLVVDYVEPWAKIGQMPLVLYYSEDGWLVHTAIVKHQALGSFKQRDAPLPSEKRKWLPAWLFQMMALPPWRQLLHNPAARDPVYLPLLPLARGATHRLLQTRLLPQTFYVQVSYHWVSRFPHTFGKDTTHSTVVRNAAPIHKAFSQWNKSLGKICKNLKCSMYQP